jgi:hypothetical protein
MINALFQNSIYLDTHFFCTGKVEVCSLLTMPHDMPKVFVESLKVYRNIITISEASKISIIGIVINGST